MYPTGAVFAEERATGLFPSFPDSFAYFCDRREFRAVMLPFERREPLMAFVWWPARGVFYSASAGGLDLVASREFVSDEANGPFVESGNMVRGGTRARDEG